MRTTVILVLRAAGARDGGLADGRSDCLALPPPMHRAESALAACFSTQTSGARRAARLGGPHGTIKRPAMVLMLCATAQDFETTSNVDIKCGTEII